MIITAELLTKMRACKEAINFIKHDYPEGIDLDKYEIKGEHRGWVAWLNEELDTKYEYDSNNNPIKETYPDGSVYKYEYDSNNNPIKKTRPDGRVYTWEYPFGAIMENGEKVCWLEEKKR